MAAPYQRHELQAVFVHPDHQAIGTGQAMRLPGQREAAQAMPKQKPTTPDQSRYCKVEKITIIPTLYDIVE
jgi:hypothetical protein